MVAFGWLSQSSICARVISYSIHVKKV